MDGDDDLAAIAERAAGAYAELHRRALQRVERWEWWTSTLPTGRLPFARERVRVPRGRRVDPPADPRWTTAHGFAGDELVVADEYGWQAIVGARYLAPCHELGFHFQRHFAWDLTYVERYVYEDGRLVEIDRHERLGSPRRRRLEYDGDRVVAEHDHWPGGQYPDHTWAFAYRPDGALDLAALHGWVTDPQGAPQRPVAELEDEYAAVLARAIAESVRATGPAAPARIALSWTVPYEPLDLTIAAIGADARDSVPAADAWFPLAWPDAPADERSRRLLARPEVRAAGEALEHAYLERVPLESELEPSRAIAETVRALPDALARAGVVPAADLEVRAVAFED